MMSLPVKVHEYDNSKKYFSIIKRLGWQLCPYVHCAPVTPITHIIVVFLSRFRLSHMMSANIQALRTLCEQSDVWCVDVWVYLLWEVLALLLLILHPEVWLSENPRLYQLKAWQVYIIIHMVSARVVVKEENKSQIYHLFELRKKFV